MRGKSSLICGNIVTKNNVAIIARYKGNIGFKILPILTLPILQPTKSTLPTGGVHKPIDKFKIIIIPKCKGDIPKDSATGKNIGVKISTAGVMSIKLPTINNVILIINNMINGFSERVNIRRWIGSSP